MSINLILPCKCHILG